jgi:GTP-binding protein
MPVDGAIRVSILGRPNVGKSMLTNRILGEERTIVSPVAGTTRDYIDIPVSLHGQDYVFVDTAGIRRKARIDDEIEKQSVIRSIRNVGMAHVCLFLIDPKEPMTEQDRRLCGIIMEQGKPFVVVVNKNDLLTQQDRKQVAHQLDFALKFMPDLRIVYISALTGRGVEKLLPLVNELYRKTTFAAGTGQLNRILAKLTDTHTPPLVGNRRLKFFYVNQVGKVPPRFRIVCNRPDDVPDNYARYLINSLKKELDLEGIPLKVDFAGR